MKVSDIIKGNIREINMIRPLADKVFVESQFSSLLTDVIEVTESNGGSSKCVFPKSDISLLFNQQRLNKLGRDGVQAFLDSMQVQNTAMQSIREKISDDDLIEFCKSRYIQSQSELLAWSQYLSNNLDKITSTLKSDDFDVDPPSDNPPTVDAPNPDNVPS